MKSLGDEVVKKAMWLYPKVSGFNPSERWGHSACCYNGVVYIFGGCCGGLHFSDVLTLNLDTMTWNTLVTTGQRPGARDSHSSVLVGHKMIVMGGTNGSKKVNDLHILDLRTKEWSSPTCEGTPPSPRESHTATLVGDDKLVIFGGSGEGDANYLNDLHVLDLNIMKWTSPGGFGDLPVPRDSHIAVALGNKLLLYGGDCGDRYLGEVDVLDMGTLTWSRLAVQGSLPGVRAGHAAVTIGTRVFIIGGVGDKLYYSDIWILDITTCSWTQLSIRGQHPQGRFSHTAVVTDSDVAIYGGCGEDERPLNELLILQLGDQHPNGRYNISMCKIFGKHWSQEKRKSPQGTCTNLDVNQALPRNSDNFHLKKRRNNDSKVWELESEQEEHSLSLSQNSSPSQSDHEQTPMQKHSASVTETAIVSYPFPMMKEKNQMQRNHKLDPRNSIQKTPQESHFMGEEHPRQLKPDQFLCVNPGRQEVQFLSSEHKPIETRLNHTLIGAEIQGKVDGAFDSGYLMTANVNGRILRGVLFTPGPGVMSRTTFLPQSPSLVVNSPVSVAQQYSTAHPISPTYVRSSQRPETLTNPEPPIQRFVKSHAVKTTPSFSRASGNRNDLHDVTLTLGGSAGGYGEL